VCACVRVRVAGDIDEAYLAKLESLPKSYNVFESLS
jgi:hypothetical protein